MYDRAFFVIFLSLMIVFTASEIWAQTLVFDQDTYIHEHNGFLTIIDSSTNVTSIEAQVTSSSGDVTISLYKVDNNTYKSNLIHFSNTTANLPGEYPVVNVEGLNSTMAKYNGVESTSVPIEPSSSSVNLSNDYSGPLDDFTLENNPECPLDFGGDSDGDYICNNWETGGRIVSLNEVTSNYVLSPNCDLGIDYEDDPLGVKVCPDPDVKDIFIEIDYMKSHKPNVEALEKVVEAFRNAPVDNPSSSKFPTGINLHIFIDEEINHADEMFFDTSDGGFFEMKAKQFGLATEKNSTDQWDNPGDKVAKAQIFYYYLWGHDRAGHSGSSGVSEQNGNDGMVTLGQFVGMVGTLDQQAGTFMHEFGHNIGLDHGGGKGDTDNCKPNLLSVMTYSRQFSDLIDRPLDYSRNSVGTQTDQTTLGDEETLQDRKPDVSKYDDCPFNLSNDNMDQDFDGIADLCDSQTDISSDITIDRDVTFSGDIIIEPNSVLTINANNTMSFDSEGKILVKSGGKLLVKSGGKIDGFSAVDSDLNEVKDYLEDSPMVFGDNGQAVVANTNQGNISWPSNWKDLRFIKDTAGNFVCPPPDLNGDGNEDDQDLLLLSDSVELTSVDQWSLLDFSRRSSDWSTGRPVSSNDHHETSLKNSSGLNEFPVTKTVSGLDIHQIGLKDSLRTDQFPEIEENRMYSKQTQVTICHYPPENPDNPITTTVKVADLEFHLDNGDRLGACNGKEDIVEIIIKSGSGDEKLYPNNSSCTNCFFPSSVKIDVGTTVKWINLDWTQPHSITSVFPNITDPELKFDYSEGELDNHYFKSGQSFTHTFEKQGTFHYSCKFHPNMEGIIYVGTEKDDLEDSKNDEGSESSEKHEHDELTIGNVRAAHSVLVDNVLGMIDKLDPQNDFKDPSDKEKLKQDLEDIRQNVLKGKMPEALAGYIKFSDSVTLLVTSQTSEREILDVLDRNIDVTKRNVPEFETLSILVLIISTMAIIVLSRRSSVSSLNNRSF